MCICPVRRFLKSPDLFRLKIYLVKHITMASVYTRVILGYKYLYEKKIKDVTHLLKEIQNYKNGEG